MAAACSLLIYFIEPCNAQAKRPNIVVIVADDMGYADIGIHGSKDIPTPNIDSLARNGVRFTDAYVSGPYCSPTRAGLMTGKYPQRFGHEFNILNHRAEHAEVGLPVSEKTIADHLRGAGYRTALFGKWHLGTAARFHPMERGFDEFFGFLEGAHAYTTPEPQKTYPLYDGRKPVVEPAYLTDVIAERSVEFINRNRDKPFFLYQAFNAVHTPMQAPEKYLARVSHIKGEPRRTYAAMLIAMDDGIGRTLAALKAAGVEDNTLIFFFSDNGGPTIFGGINGSSNGPLKGSKRQTWEGGIRVPFIASWKGHIPAGTTYSRPIIQLDVMPTALAAVGVKVPKQAKLDGVDLLPFLRGKKVSDRGPHKTLFWRLGGIMAIRKGDWKLVRMTDNGFQEPPAPISDLAAFQLYDLSTDIGEANDLARKHPEKVKELAADWHRWTTSLATPGWYLPPPLRQEQ